MKEERYCVILDKYDRNITLYALEVVRSQFKEQGTSTKTVDDLIIKLLHVPTKKPKVVSCLIDEKR